MAAKRSLVLESRDGRASLGERKKRAVLQSGWGQPREAQRLRGANPSLGTMAETNLLRARWHLSIPKIKNDCDFATKGCLLTAW